MEHYITLAGIAVQTLLFLAGGYAMVIRNDAGNKALGREVGAMREELKKLAEVITEQAVQNMRIDNLNSQVAMIQRTVEDLRRGDGYVVGHRRGIDGEYKG